MRALQGDAQPRPCEQDQGQVGAPTLCQAFQPSTGPHPRMHLGIRCCRSTAGEQRTADRNARGRAAVSGLRAWNPNPLHDGKQAIISAAGDSGRWPYPQAASNVQRHRPARREGRAFSRGGLRWWRLEGAPAFPSQSLGEQDDWAAGQRTRFTKRNRWLADSELWAGTAEGGTAGTGISNGRRAADAQGNTFARGTHFGCRTRNPEAAPLPR